MDTMTKAQRSYTMSQIRSNNTGPERRLAMLLVRSGLSFHRWTDLPGKPDIVLKRHKVAIFVDGCYFHGCKKHCKIPKTNVRFWTDKIDTNKARDRRVNKTLRKDGWLVWRFWEHELKKSGSTRLIFGRLKALQAISGTLWPSKGPETRGSETE